MLPGCEGSKVALPSASRNKEGIRKESWEGVMGSVDKQCGWLSTPPTHSSRLSSKPTPSNSLTQSDSLVRTEVAGSLGLGPGCSLAQAAAARNAFTKGRLQQDFLDGWVVGRGLGPP